MSFPGVLKTTTGFWWWKSEAVGAPERHPKDLRQISHHLGHGGAVAVTEKDVWSLKQVMFQVISWVTWKNKNASSVGITSHVCCICQKCWVLKGSTNNQTGSRVGGNSQENGFMTETYWKYKPSCAKVYEFPGVCLKPKILGAQFLSSQESSLHMLEGIVGTLESIRWRIWMAWYKLF